MSFLGQAVIIIAMALISLSLGGISYIVLTLKLDTAALVSLASFAFMVIFQMAAWRTRDRKQTGRDLQDLGFALENITRDIAILNNKVAAYDQAGVLRAVQDVVNVRSAVQGLQVEMQQAASTLQQHYELIQAARNPVVFGQKKPVSETPPSETPPAASEPTQAPPLRHQGRLGHLSEQAAIDLVRKTIDEGRIEILLQPIVTLPQRKIHAYEVLSRLKTSKGETLLPEDFLGYLRKSPLGLLFDTLVLYRAVQLVRRMQTRNKEIGVVVNLCASTLAGGEEFRTLVEFLSANRALSSSLMLEISQSAYQEMGPLEFESMHAISQLGFGFSLDQVRDLRLDVKGLFDRNFRFIKVPGEILLGQGGVSADIHPADLSDLLARYGIKLIADKIEAEATVIDLLDYDVPFAQGFLFAPPRPVKAEVLDDDLAGNDGLRAVLRA
jgi:cyclic-di-GMP phosphodiesterase TipF (flagellum assembly factor)